MLNDVLRLIAPVLAQSGVVLGIVAILIGWAVWSGLLLFRSSARLTRAFHDATAALADSADEGDFSGKYETVSAILRRLPLIGPSWSGFTRTLVIAEGRPIVATADPRDWFDLAELFREAGSDLRYHAALPGLLVGAGLMVTFLGLAAALTAASGVVAEGVSQSARNGALRDLLGAASVKFITSLVGLSLSIAYALFRKARLKRVERAFARFAAVLHVRMPFRTAAYLQAEANLILERQRAEIERVSNEFFVNLGSTLERSFDAGLDQHVGPLREAIERLASGLSTQNQDAMETMLSRFLERLEGTTGDNMRGTAATLEAVGTRLDGLQAGMDGAAQRMTRAAEEMATGMGRGAEAAMGGIAGQLDELARSLREAAEEARRGSRTAGDDLAARMADTSASLAAAATAFQLRLEAGAADGAARLAAPIEALLAQLRDLTINQREAGNEAASALAATVARAAAALEGTAARAADALGGGAQDASARLVAATEAMRDELRAVLERFGATLGESGRALSQGAEAGGTSLRDAAATFGGSITDAADRLARAGEQAGDALRSGAADAQGSLVQSAGALATGSAALAERLAALGVSSDRLAERTQALERAAQATESPLADAAANLRLAAEAARTAAVPLDGSASGLAAAAAALAASERQAEQLAARLVEAAGRFAGLDESLARTLRHLGEGLDGYQQSVSRFVGDVDQGFSRSVQSLTAVAKDLEDTLEDMGHRRNGRS